MLHQNAKKNCQSCGMPFKHDPQQGGTNADGSKSLLYCSYCFQRGQFTQPDFTVDDMKAFVKEKLKEMKIPGFLAGFLPKVLAGLNAGN